MTEALDDAARTIRVLEAKLRRSEANRARLEDSRDINDALHRRVIEQMQATEHRLRESEQQAQLASKAKSEFLANMSHEIRTPLTGIIGLAELMRTTALDDRQRSLMHNVIRAATVLARLIDDVLDFSRIEAGKLQLDDGDFDPHDAIADAVDLVMERATAQGLTLTCQFPPPVLLRGDAFRLRQVLINLLGNAVKFTPAGEISVRADLVPRDGACDLVIEVCDTGIGVPADQLDLIFEAFRQADGSTTRQYGGSGLGLAISREIVDAMGGSLTARRRESGGSAFTVTLPGARPQAERTVTARADNRDNAAPVVERRGARVLVAEDNEVNREVIASLLEEFGATVTLVSDGREAIAELARSAFDLAFLDLHMPHHDGVEVARFAKGASVEGRLSRNLTTPLVALTAAVLRADRMRCEEAGMDDFVAKPFDRASLGAAFGRWGMTRVRDAIDRSVLADLGTWISAAKLQPLIAKFVAVTERAMERLVAAAQDGDSGTVADAAHALKSSAAQLGAVDLAARLEAIEMAAREGVLPPAAMLSACRQAAFDAIDELPRAT